MRIDEFTRRLTKGTFISTLARISGNNALACAVTLVIAQMKILPFADESATQSVLMYLLRDLAKGKNISTPIRDYRHVNSKRQSLDLPQTVRGSCKALPILYQCNYIDEFTYTMLWGNRDNQVLIRIFKLNYCILVVYK